MKIIRNILILGLFILPFLGALQTYAVEQTTKGVEYVPLVNIQGLTSTSTSNQDIGTYLSNAYKWIISLAIALAVIMLTWHAFKYILSEASITSKDKARKGMGNAVIGLLLVLSAALILNTINPDILKTSVSLSLPEKNKAPEPEEICIKETVPRQPGVYYVTNYKKPGCQNSMYVFFLTSGDLGACNKKINADTDIRKYDVNAICFEIFNDRKWRIKEQTLVKGQEGIYPTYTDARYVTYIPSIKDNWTAWNSESECNANLNKAGLPPLIEKNNNFWDSGDWRNANSLKTTIDDYLRWYYGRNFLDFFNSLYSTQQGSTYGKGLYDKIGAVQQSCVNSQTDMQEYYTE